MRNSHRVRASFRDPSGFLFVEDGVLYRQINSVYAEDYDHLISSGLYAELTGNGQLVPHDEVNLAPPNAERAYKIIRPYPVSFVSYPYEWCFSQLKDAALTTLRIQGKALEHGMALKDASSYNIQFQRGRAVLIDTLSFERYREGKPWVAYRQFCQHFLAPLALMAYRDVRLGKMLRLHIDGVPLDLAAKLLPLTTRLRPGLMTHVHLHARSQVRYADDPESMHAAASSFSNLSMLALLDSLETAVKGLRWEPARTVWADYYEEQPSYSSEALAHKQQLVADFLAEFSPRTVWDLGANTGLFSRIAAASGAETVCFDLDPAAVEINYRRAVEKGEEGVLPLVLDLCNPTPGIGWHNSERMSLLERGPADTALALALVHHLAIGNNVPFPAIAEFLAQLCGSLIIEFIPKTDSLAQRLLATREDIFADYHQEGFEAAFGQHFEILRAVPLKDSERTMYAMRKKPVRT